MATATQMLNTARSQVGYREGKNNNNKYGVWYTATVKNGYNWNYQPYCAMGLTWCAAQIPGGISAIGGHWAYCPSWANWFRKNGLFYGSPRRGDIAFFDWTGQKRRGYEMHVAVVESVSGDYIKTIEFNTVAGSGNQSDGGGVFKRTRHISQVVGFGRPRYAAETNVVPIKTVPIAYNSNVKIPLVVDGVWGPATTRRVQQMLGLTVDGVMGPQTFNALARWLRQTPIGRWSVQMKSALQFRVGVAQDGVIGPVTVKAFQRYLNRNVS